MKQNDSIGDAGPAPGGVQAIARAASVLRALEDAPGGRSLGEIALAVGLPKSTVHRLVGAMAAEGLVTPASGGKVRLGSALAQLGSAARRGLGEELGPLLRSLNAEIDETVDLSVLEGRGMRFLDQVPAAHRLRAVSAPGAEFPLHCTANGKAVLAALGPEAAAGLLPPRPRAFTPNTITDLQALRSELEEVRNSGVAFDREEHTEGISAVGAAVVVDEEPVAAISVPAPTARFRRNEERYATAVRRAADTASRTLAGSRA
ncbi:MAG: IclR family transcriptional regulator [Solirubrobacterales bacterium]